MKKDRFGISITFYAVLGFVFAILGQTLLGGLLLGFSIVAVQDEWLTRQTLQAFFLSLISGFVSVIIGAVSWSYRIPFLGTGSGILGILALMFGAQRVVGTDLDICAVEAVRENLESNHIDPENFEMMIGNIITEKEIQDRVGYGCYDIVAANILADVLVALSPVIVNQMKPGGIYITSGIIDDKEAVVVEAVKAAGLEVVEVAHQGEWVGVTARKPV